MGMDGDRDDGIERKTKGLGERKITKSLVSLAHQCCLGQTCLCVLAPAHEVQVKWPHQILTASASRVHSSCLQNSPYPTTPREDLSVRNQALTFFSIICLTAR